MFYNTFAFLGAVGAVMGPQLLYRGAAEIIYF
jgi:hypothetical protein